MRSTPFIFFDIPHTYRGYATQQDLKNKYFYKHLELINQFMVDFNETYEWKLKMIDKLVSRCGYPVKLNWIQRLIASIP